MILSCLLISCATTFDAALLKPTAGSINPLLPRLKMQQNAQQITSATGKEVTSNTYMYTIFDREMENICEQKGDFKGTIEPIITINRIDFGGWGFFLASTCLVYIPNLLGFPLNTLKAQLEVEFEIKDKNGDRVWKKTYYEKDKATVTLYSPIRYDEMTLKMYRKMMTNFKKDLQNDINEVTRKLNQ